MCVEPVLHRDNPAVQAAVRLIAQFEASLPATWTGGPLRLTLAGGMAAALYGQTRLSEDVDAIFSHRVLLPQEAMIAYTDEQGYTRYLTWDHNYNSTLGLMHPDALDAALPVGTAPRGQIQIFVLTPTDLAVSKLARYADPDRADIQSLIRQGLVHKEAFAQRVTEALDFYVGDTAWILGRLADLQNHWPGEQDETPSAGVGPR
ncbi:MAG: hypothetical protein M0Z85_07665 [Gammaproteobacteria bacterium]|nr:hypothetical protein [Gammaproteobacteria bacterium]